MSAVNVRFSDERLCLKNKERIDVTNKKLKTKQYKGKIIEK